MGAASSAPSTVPYGSHSALLNTTLNCITGQGNPFQVPFDISATAPLSSNTEVYFTDIQAHGRVGPSIYTLIENTTIYFSTNASPSTFRLTSERTVSGDDTAANVPVSGTARAGPFKMTTDFARLRIQYVTIHAFNADEDFTLNCTLPPHDIISVANAGLSSPDTAPANGVRASFPTTNNGSKSEIANFPVSCTQGNYNFSLQATIPQNVPATKAFNVSNVVTFLTTKVGTDTAYVAQYGVSAGEQVPGIAVTLANAKLSTYDLSRGFVATDSNTASPLNGGTYTNGSPQTITINAPTRGSLSYSLTAGSAGVFSAAYRFISGTLHTNNGESGYYCPNSTANVLLTAPIV